MKYSEDFDHPITVRWPYRYQIEKLKNAIERLGVQRSWHSKERWFYGGWEEDGVEYGHQKKRFFNCIFICSEYQSKNVKNDSRYTEYNRLKVF